MLMRKDIPEVAELLDAAQKYLQEELSIPWLHGYVGQCEYCPAVQDDIHLKDEISCWREMLGQTWNEWGLSKDPIPESDFKAWIQSRLTTWDSR